MAMRKQRLVGLGLEVGITLAILAAIWMLTADSTSPYVPPFSEVLKVFRETWLFADFGTDVVPSLIRLFVGFGIALALGVPIGLLLGTSWTVRMLATPVVTFVRSIPPPVLIPVAIVIFGIGDMMKIAVIGFVCIWPIALNVQDGVLGLDRMLSETADAYQLTRVDRLRYVLLPGVAPRIFAGARISIALALLMLVVAEMLGSTDGIGFYVMNAEQSYAIPQMWAGVLLLGLLGFGLNALLEVGERRILAWKQN
ncbi:MAG: ABC transporter permease [Solirubrobacterales bacterium]